MIILQGQNLSRLFGSDILFDQLDIQIQDTSRIALVGRNGSGKSTLLKMLADIEAPSGGTISKVKQLKIGYLDQHSAVDTTNSIWDEMLSVYAETIALHKQVEQAALQLSDDRVLNDTTAYELALKQYDTLQHQLEEMGGYRYEADIKSILHGFGFANMDYTRPISELSGGQKTRLAMAKLLLEKHDLLILDEPTNHLDIDTLSWLENYLTHYSGALLIVSHDRYFLDKVANEVYEISHHKMHHYKGNYTYYLEEKERRMAQWEKAYEQQQSDIKKMEDFIAKNIVRASTTKRAQSRRKQLEKLTRIEKPTGDEKVARFSFQSEKESGNVVLQAENLAIGYEDTTLSAPIHLDIRKQDAIALVGPNGIGKTTLLKTLLQQLPALGGHIHYGTNVSIGYYDQEQRRLNAHKDVLHEVWDDFPTINEKDIRQLLGGFLFSGDDVQKSIGLLSGGEKARVLLSKLALQHDNFLILDEPTNHLDLDSKEVLENALINFDGTILFISHDRYFINRVATRIIELSPMGSTLYDGDYDDYLTKKAQIMPLEPQVLTQTTTQQKQNFQETKDFQRLVRQLTRTIEKLEADMATLEEENARLNEQLADPNMYSNHEKAYALQQTIDENTHQYDDLLTEWENTHQQLEELQQ
ncbi:ABC-F family ATP-binding cassette domain-containing protein [Carnobacteriaceae bacterium zg-ZUI252]|nr:ABC-F family ATP-binding cassette domain-containing protein [Carnobacteriaceae bacterium zg-ZUI252]MBS4769590.1 ABC-F family ATP-binding cassette domain-containing protein [Carnobacteriaceae bacterium zg-ZUI240]QTU83053.1 ABC-F family ATP-binding cassette domain-containing protein [Carnobacteriaceae bacterium zg-C25]